MEELSVKKVREILAEEAERLSDEEIEEFIEQANRFAESYLDLQKERNRT